MAYDEALAGRIREELPGDAEVTERKMFGGLMFLVDGRMCAGVVGTEIMVRIGHEAAARALELDYAREMDFTGRPMRNMVYLDPSALSGPDLERWLTEAADYARTRPITPSGRPRPRARRKPVAVTIRDLNDPNGLVRKLREIGVPARFDVVMSSPEDVARCLRQTSPALREAVTVRASTDPHVAALLLHPSAIPPGETLGIFVAAYSPTGFGSEGPPQVGGGFRSADGKLTRFKIPLIQSGDFAFEAVFLNPDGGCV